MTPYLPITKYCQLHLHNAAPSLHLLLPLRSELLSSFIWATVIALNSVTASTLALTVSSPHSNTVFCNRSDQVSALLNPPGFLSHSHECNRSLPCPTRPWPHHDLSDYTAHNHAPSAMLNLLLLLLHSRYTPASGPLHMLFLLQATYFLQISSFTPFHLFSLNNISSARSSLITVFRTANSSHSPSLSNIIYFFLILFIVCQAPSPSPRKEAPRRQGAWSACAYCTPAWDTRPGTKRVC